MYSQKVDEIVENADELHRSFYEKNVFSGPSLHFHSATMKYAGRRDEERFYEYIYATLTAWGMHRMGSRGAKMNSFEKFNDSLSRIMPDIERAMSLDIGNVGDNDWGLLKKIFLNVDVMQSRVKMVGNSKVMTHLLPAVVAPIDRQYTLNYLNGNTTIHSSIDRQWEMFRNIHENFYYKIAANNDFLEKAKQWVRNEELKWDTSILKVIDNLVVGERK